MRLSKRIYNRYDHQCAHLDNAFVIENCAFCSTDLYSAWPTFDLGQLECLGTIQRITNPRCRRIPGRTLRSRFRLPPWPAVRHTVDVNSLARWMTMVLLLGLFISRVQAGFTSLHVFGDGICTTTNGPGGPYYYGNRYSNGRVWVELLAERQGLNYESNKNWSYYGHYSSDLVLNLASFPAPPDASTALFVVWCADADFVWNVNNYGMNTTLWANAINQSLTNHIRAITNLYGKGVRTLIMPNAVDIAKVPLYVNYAEANKSFIRQQILSFNSAFAATLDQLKTSLPGLTFHVPDVFTLLDSVVANPADYGLIKPGTYVLEDLPPAQWSLNGPGTNYLYWDDLNPTAKFHAHLADYVQQFIWPARIGSVTSLAGSIQLNLANLPIGRNGFAEGSRNLAGWTIEANIDSTNATQTIFLPSSGPLQFYRLRFPFSWSWP